MRGAASSIRTSRGFIAWAVTCAACVDLIAYSIAVPVLPDLSRRFGATPTAIGLLFASFGVTLLLASIPMGAISDRMGRKGPLLGGLVALAAASLLCAFANTMPWLFAARMIQGIADAVTWVVGFALIADLYRPSERGRVMGLVMAGTSFGLMIGPSIGGWLYESGGIRLPFLTVAAMAVLAAIPLAWARVPSVQVPHESLPVRRLVRNQQVVACMSVVALSAATIAMLEPVLSLWLASDLRLRPSQIGVLFGMAAVATTMLHPVYGRLTDRFGGRPMTTVGLILTAAMLPVLSVGWSFESAATLYVLQAAAIALIVTPSLTYMAETVSRAGAGSFGVAYGLYNVGWGTGLLAGPALGGFLYERMGLFWLTVVWAPAVIALTFWLAAARSPSVRSASTRPPSPA